MLISSSRLITLFAAMLLVACASAPKPAQQTVEAPVESAPQQAVEMNETELAPPEPEPVDANQQLYDQALVELKNGDTGEALQLLTEVSLNAADKPRLYTNLGLAHFRLQQPEQAEQAFNQAIARDPDDAVAHNHLGILQRRKGEFQGALYHYQKAIEIDSNYAGAHLNLGILFDLYLQDLELALQQYQQYRSLADEESALIDGWIIDIERRLKSGEKT